MKNELSDNAATGELTSGHDGAPDQRLAGEELMAALRTAQQQLQERQRQQSETLASLKEFQQRVMAERDGLALRESEFLDQQRQQLDPCVLRGIDVTAMNGPGIAIHLEQRIAAVKILSTTAVALEVGRRRRRDGERVGLVLNSTACYLHVEMSVINSLKIINHETFQSSNTKPNE